MNIHCALVSSRIFSVGLPDIVVKELIVGRSSAGMASLMQTRETGDGDGLRCREKLKAAEDSHSQHQGGATDEAGFAEGECVDEVYKKTFAC